MFERCDNRPASPAGAHKASALTATTIHASVFVSGLPGAVDDCLRTCGTATESTSDRESSATEVRSAGIGEYSDTSHFAWRSSDRRPLKFGSLMRANSVGTSAARAGTLRGSWIVLSETLSRLSLPYQCRTPINLGVAWPFSGEKPGQRLSLSAIRLRSARNRVHQKCRQSLRVTLTFAPALTLTRVSLRVAGECIQEQMLANCQYGKAARPNRLARKSPAPNFATKPCRGLL